MKKQLILVGLMLNILSVQAQYDPHFYYRNETDYTLPEEFDGRFLIDNTFRKGELKTRKGLESTELKYRFDQVDRALQVQANGHNERFPTTDIVYCKLFFKNDTIVFEPIALSDAHTTRLFQVVYKTATLQLYRDIQKTVNSKNDKFVLEKDYHYYIRRNDKERLQEVDISAKSFIKVLPEKKNQITSVFKGKHKEDLTVSQVVHIMGELDKSKIVQ